MLTRILPLVAWLANALVVFAADTQPASRPAGGWQIGTPITTYWAGPGYGGKPLTDADATQLAEANFNLVWSPEKGLDTAHKHKLRALLNDGLIAPATLDDPAKRKQLDDLVARVKTHPAMYAYFITDEPNAGAFRALGKLVAYLRERDPAHMAYINLFPTYANNDQLGTKGETVAAYKEHLKQYLDIVKPAIVSYDHYHFATGGKDTAQYFLNLALIRQAAMDAGLPFLNIVQACTWDPGMRAPTPHELRFLVYTTLAYGGQGISYFVYSYEPFYKPGVGQLVTPDGKPTELWRAAKDLNRDFVAIAGQLQKLRSLGVYHAGMVPPGGEVLPKDLPFTLDPPVERAEYKPPQPIQGLLIGTFGPGDKGPWGEATHAVVVNLDYKEPAKLNVAGRGPFELFIPARNAWTAAGPRAGLLLPAGGGLLIRLRPGG